MESQQPDTQQAAPSRSGVSRREVLRIGGVGSLAAVASTLIGGCGPCAAPPPGAQTPGGPAFNRVAGKKPRNIIFMVSDGMSAGVPTIAEPFSQRLRKRGTHWHRLMRDRGVVHGQLSTRSLDSLVTDSSAASSAWGSGSRVDNAALNVLPDGTKLTPIATLLTNANRRVGLVTTDVMTGATPAGFACVSPSRKLYDDLALQYQDCVDVILGGGRRYFDPLSRADHLDLIGLYQKGGYDFLADRAAVLSRPPSGRQRVLGLFDEMQMPYTIDHMQSDVLRAKAPTLAEMSRYALRVLSSSPDGFFIMIEGARIDHAAHVNDAGAMMWDQLAFDDAIGEALAFIEHRDDTLLVISSDHGNGNPGLVGMGKHYHDTDACFEVFTQAKASFAMLFHALASPASMGDKAAVHGYIKENFAVDLTPEETAVITRALATRRFEDDLWEEQRTWFGALSQALANRTGLAFNAHSHTADNVICTALGPGAEAFSGLTEHPEVFRIFADYNGVSYVNPSAEKTAPAAEPAKAAAVG